MNVYRVEYFYGGNESTAIVHFIAANTMEQVLASHNPDDEAIASIEILGGLIFATGGVETAKALSGGRQVSLDEAKASITNSHLVSFEDGRSYKSLTRHLKAHGLTFDQYKAKWGLPEQYPSVHPSYTIMRRALAAGLGRGKKGAGVKKK